MEREVDAAVHFVWLSLNNAFLISIVTCVACILWSESVVMIQWFWYLTSNSCIFAVRSFLILASCLWTSQCVYQQCMIAAVLVTVFVEVNLCKMHNLWILLLLQGSLLCIYATLDTDSSGSEISCWNQVRKSDRNFLSFHCALRYFLLPRIWSRD